MHSEKIFLKEVKKVFAGLFQNFAGICAKLTKIGLKLLRNSGRGICGNPLNFLSRGAIISVSSGKECIFSVNGSQRGGKSSWITLLIPP